MKIKPNNVEIEVDVDCDYEPAEKEVWTFPNGDPGHPGSSEVFYVTSVKHNGMEIIDYLDSAIIEKIEDQLKSDQE